MKKALSVVMAFLSAVVIGALQASADSGVPMTGDENWWIYLILAVVAVAMVVVLAVTSKKK
ncbi:MAG: LPXTG cell wall anchor domain-containing protein [Clostridia bacterium]|nr:LPXTG cell wall anchor domain-containing protein [Clostridia bacterium]